MMNLATKCPFLKQVPTDFLRKVGPSLYAFAERCPVMRNVLTAINDPTTSVPIRTFHSERAGGMSSAGKCPFSSSAMNTAPPTAKPALADNQEQSQVVQNCVDGNEKCPSPLTPPAYIDEPEIEIVYPVSSEPQPPKSSKPATTKTIAEERSTERSKFDYDQFFDGMIDRKKQDHSYRVFRKVNRLAANFPLAEDYSFNDEGDTVTVWCSNDYLGMSRHPLVTNAAKNVVNKLGVGAGGTRNISGTSSYHAALEASLADWHGKDAGLLFTSCYVANDTALFTLGKHLPGCILFSDAGNHASMIHGIRTSGAQKQIYRHNDPEHLEDLLSKADPHAPKIVIFESVHSMSGAVCPVERICDIAHKYGALTFVDEVHAVGLYGARGAGIGERNGCMDKMDIISGTLGKAVGVIGGYLVGDKSTIDTLRSYGSGFIFTTALPPDKVHAAHTSIELLKGPVGRELREKHQSIVCELRKMLLAAGLPVEYSPSHIIPVYVGDADKCVKVSQYLQKEHNIYVQSINYPTVERGEEKLRIAPTPFHTRKMSERLVLALCEAWEAVDLERLSSEACHFCSLPAIRQNYREQYVSRV